MKIRTLLVKVFRLNRQEWRDLFAAQWAIIAAQLSVWLQRRGTLISPGNASDESCRHEPPEPAVLLTARAIDRVASFGLIRAQCLVRSIALARLLDARGYPDAIVKVGVCRKDQKMLAHAWVEYHGFVVGDLEQYVRQFDQMPGLDIEF